MHFRFLIVSLVLFLAGVAHAGDASIKVEDINEVTISYMPWDLTTTHSLSAADIRAHPSYCFSVYGPWNIENLFKRLPLQKMKPTTIEPGDTRLVIDLTLANGNHVSFHASRFYLYSEDSKFRWRVTPEFKRLFRFEEMSLLK